MAEFTPNYNLYKPNRADSEAVDTTLANNFATIDTEMKKNANEVAAVKQDLETKTTALQEDINFKTSTLQEQFDSTVIEGDSSVEAAQARVRTVGQETVSFPTLVYRLNDTDEQVNVALKTVEFNYTVTVGTGGDYQTINEALTFLSQKYPKYRRQGINVELKLKTGFIMKEQVAVKGINLGWVTITSEDAVVMIDRDSISEVLIESRKPAFCGLNNAVLPTIGCLFEYTTGTATAYFDGIIVAFGSKVQLLPGAGVNKADRGLGAYYHSEAFCYMEGLTEGGAGTGAGAVKGVSFRNCIGRAFMASYGSEINCARSQLQNCTGDIAVYVIWGSRADIYQSNISNATNTAVHARDGSFINARETNVSDSNRGYHALHNARINARYAVNEWSGEGAKRCRDYGVLASYNSQIDASRLPVDGSKIGVHASNTSSVSFIDSATATGCTTGVHATGGSNVDCYGVNVSNCTDKGIFAENASVINAQSAIANGCNEGIVSSKGSTINANGAFVQNCTSKGIVGFELGVIDANGVDATGSPAGFSITRGSTIVATNGVGVLSVTKNTLTVNGIIYQ